MSLARAWRVIQRASGQAEEPQVAADVWRWTGRKYRVRAIFFLLTDALLFAGLGCFTFWLRTGDPLPFLSDQYWNYLWQSLDPTLDRQATLLEFLLQPIPAQQVPWMFVIHGLVLASLTAIPILVSMLYRLPLSLVFTAIIAFFATLPWLAITVTFCCVLARWKRIQFSFRYATALISLLPVVLYYLMATRNTPGVDRLAPLELAKLYLPYAIALIAACVVMAIVLTIARVVNYRPGAIAPLMAVLFATPMVLFETKVGRDELSYRLLERGFGPGSREHFLGHADAEEIILRTAKAIRESSPVPQPPIESLVQLVRDDLKLRVALGQTDQSRVARTLMADWYAQKDMAINECRRFLLHFPYSEYVPSVLYLQGRATDLRLNREFTYLQDSLILAYNEDFPNAASADVWRKLAEMTPDSAPGCVAMYRLAVLETRRGHVQEALDLLSRLIANFGKRKIVETAPTETSGWRNFLARRPPANTLGIDVTATVQNARKLENLLSENRVKELEPTYDYPILRRLFSIDPHHPEYARNLRELLAATSADPQDPTNLLRDNIELLLALTNRSRSRRIEELRTLVDRFAKDKRCDALPHARFELAAAYQTDNLLDEARTLYQTIQTEHPDSPWATEANWRLAVMGQRTE
ncbi:MAG: tetratricopeptide repeat protein [Phycisphaerae bacterium]